MTNLQVKSLFQVTITTVEHASNSNSPQIPRAKAAKEPLPNHDATTIAPTNNRNTPTNNIDLKRSTHALHVQIPNPPQEIVKSVNGADLRNSASGIERRAIVEDIRPLHASADLRRIDSVHLELAGI